MISILVVIIMFIIFILSIFWCRKRKSRLAYICYYISEVGVIISFAAAVGARKETIEFLFSCAIMGIGWIFVKKYILKN